ncbi:MAG: FadD3 family acyl-CoA ligase [Acidimicrobiia bacterium]
MTAIDALPWKTYLELVRAAAGAHGDRAYLVDGEVTLSFNALSERVDEMSRAHLAAGIGFGDRIAIWAPNIWEWVVVALGAQSIGAVLIPLNTRFKGAEAVDILERGNVSALFTVTDFLDTNYLELIERTGAPLASLRRRVVLRGDAAGPSDSYADYVATGRSISDEQLAAAHGRVSGDSVSDILFTSGTTGAPKGVVTTHAQNLAAFQAWASVIGLDASDTHLVINPFFHAFGYKAGWLASLIAGATCLPHLVFDAGAVLTRIQDEGITSIPGPPTLFQSMLVHPHLSSFDLSSLRLAVTGAASIPVELIIAMRERLGFETVITGYGLTEACGIATMCRDGDAPEIIAATSGRAIPDVEVCCIDASGVSVPAGEAGEVVIRGYNVMREYLDDPVATTEVIDSDGWLHTGDIGVMDEHGNLRITDRVKDMFIVGGFNAYPAEIENLLLLHPDIAFAAVIGVPDERMGEVGAAYVVPKPNLMIDVDTLRTWARDQMANYKVPRYFEVLESLPMNATGKVTKFELRERFARHTATG